MRFKPLFYRPRVHVTIFFAALALAALAPVSGCKKKIPKPAVPAPGRTESGIASWYGEPYHGRRAANGEVYDMNKLTAAHRTFAFGTWVRVRNLDNGKAVEVRINDRGPFVRGRIIDLSRAAAHQVAMIAPGTAKVRLEVIRPPERVPDAAMTDRFAVQVGSFRSKDNAERLRQQMEGRHGRARVLKRDTEPVQYRVLVGEAGSLEEAEELSARIRREGVEGFAVRID
jgi:rare lipoprotein A